MLSLSRARPAPATASVGAARLAPSLRRVGNAQLARLECAQRLVRTQRLRHAQLRFASRPRPSPAAGALRSSVTANGEPSAMMGGAARTLLWSAASLASRAAGRLAEVGTRRRLSDTRARSGWTTCSATATRRRLTDARFSRPTTVATTKMSLCAVTLPACALMARRCRSQRATFSTRRRLPTVRVLRTRTWATPIRRSSHASRARPTQGRPREASASRTASAAGRGLVRS